LTRIALSALLVVAVSACSGGAGGDPTATVKHMVNLVESKQFAKIADVACAAQKDKIATQFDPGAALSGSLDGVDEQAITDAMTISFDGVTYKELERSADTARVQLTGTLKMSMDKAMVTALVKKVLDAKGVPADDATLASMTDSMVGTFEQGQPVDSDVDLVLENGQWLICGVTERASPAP
jgi:hypothetical protein